MTRGRLSVALFRIALLAYPRAFRRRFGDEMRADFRRDPHSLVSTCFALVRNGLAERGAAIARWATWPNHRHHLYAPERSRSMLWDNVRLDVRHTLRLARNAPGPVLLAILALAIGIGANTAVFTVVRGVLLRPLPYAEPGRLVTVWSHSATDPRASVPVSPADFRDVQEQARPFADVEGYFSFVTNTALAMNGQTEIVTTVSVTRGLFALLGREAALGRALAPDDPADRVVLSDGFWRRRFGGDPQVVGRTVTLDARPVTVVGVMPADFVFPYKGLLGPTGFTTTVAPDIWMPLSFDQWPLRNAAGQLPRDVRFLGALGRLRPGVSVEQAQAAFAGLARTIEETHPETNKGWTLRVVRAHDQVVGSARPALLLLLSGTAVILLMACINVANLALARSVARQRELAVRAALGARRGRLAMQALIESLMLASTGAAVGLLGVSWGVRTLVALAPADLPRMDEVAPDLAMLGAAIAVTALTGVLVALAPALAAGRADVRQALQEAGRAVSGSGGHRARATFAVSEIALAVVLTIVTVLLVRSFQRVVNIDPGFETRQVLTLHMNLPERLATPDARRAFYGAFFERLGSIPQVVAVGGTTRIPLGSTNVSTAVDVEGHPVPSSQRPEVEFRRALHDYFAAMGIPILSGRTFTREDGPSAPPVAVVNQALSRRVFGGQDPVGQRVRLGPDPSAPWVTIVGVVGDIRHSSLEAEPSPELYVNGVQNPPVSPFIVIRTSGDATAIAGAVREATRALDPSVPLYDVRTMEGIRSASLAQRRFLLVLIAVFGALALTLASVGVYGVMALMVSERTHELGVRLALGAAPLQVLGLVLGGAVRVAAAGAAIGVAIAALVTPLVKSQLFGTSAHDPLTFVAVPAVLMGIATIAALVPARKAMWIDPIRVLRYRD